MFCNSKPATPLCTPNIIVLLNANIFECFVVNGEEECVFYTNVFFYLFLLAYYLIAFYTNSTQNLHIPIAKIQYPISQRAGIDSISFTNGGIFQDLKMIHLLIDFFLFQLSLLFHYN